MPDQNPPEQPPLSLPVTIEQTARVETVGSASAKVERRSWWRRLRSLPITYKLTFGLSLVVVAGMGVLGFVVVNSQSELMQRQINEYGATIAGQYAASATELVFTDDQFGLQVLTSNLVSDPRILGAAVYDREKRRYLAKSGEVPIASALSQAKRTRDVIGDYRTWDWQRLTSHGREQMVTFLTPVSFRGVEAAEALVTFSQASVSHSFHQVIRTMVMVTIGIMVVALGIAYLMSQRMARPIRQLVAATDQLGQGNYQVVLSEKRADDLGQLIEAVNRMAQGLREKHQVEGVLSRVVANDVAQKMLTELDAVDIGSERVDASVLFVDIAGFTSMAEQSTPEAVVELLNEYFGYFTQCSRLFFGTVDKFIGDCAMVIFGAPRHSTEHRFNAVACAVVIQRLLKQLNSRRRRKGMPEIHVRIGINSGEMMAGIIGAQDRMEYTVVGDSVNLASRLSNLAEPGEILIGEAVLKQRSVFRRVKVEPYQLVKVKGKSQAVETYRVVNIDSEHQRMMDVMIDDILGGRTG